MEKCVACQFYDRNDAHSEDKGVRWGKCRRTGPIVHPVSAKAYMVEGIWPHVRDDDWCGEWVANKRRLDAAAADVKSSLLMPSGASPLRGSGPPVGSLMSPVPSTAETSPAGPLMSSVPAGGDTPHAPIAGRFGSS